MNKFLVLFLLVFSLSIYDIHAECADSLALTPLWDGVAGTVLIAISVNRKYVKSLTSWCLQE